MSKSFTTVVETKPKNMNTRTMNIEKYDRSENMEKFEKKSDTSKKYFSYMTEPRHATPDKAKRVICMAYEYNDDGTVKFGACVFRRQAPKEKFVKKDIRHTAEERLINWPLKFKLHTDDKLNLREKKDLDKVLTRIRKTMFKLGTYNKAEKLWTDSLTTETKSVETK